MGANLPSERSTANAALDIATFDKYTAELVAGRKRWSLAGSFVSIGESAGFNSIGEVFNVSANGALISIPIGWVPQCVLDPLGWVRVRLRHRAELIVGKRDLSGLRVSVK